MAKPGRNPLHMSLRLGVVAQLTVRGHPGAPAGRHLRGGGLPRLQLTRRVGWSGCWVEGQRVAEGLQFTDVLADGTAAASTDLNHHPAEAAALTPGRGQLGLGLARSASGSRTP
jgi:hypothetical protein